MADAEGAPDLRRARAAAQLLADSKRRTPAGVVRHLLAVQAQDFASVPLALRARAKGLTRAAVHRALDGGELVIGWLNRGTLHMVHRDDYWWLHALTTPQLLTANKRRLAEEGVARIEAKIQKISKLLADGPMLREEIGAALGVKAGGLTHTLMAASVEGVIVRGPIRGREQTFVLARDHVGEPPVVDREAALRELAIRYAAGHAPASDADLAYWAGIRRSEARTRNTSLSDLGSLDSPPKLLPPFDPYIMGWKERSFAIPPAYAKAVMPGGGMFRAVVLVDGLAVGTWSRAAGRVTVSAFERDVDGLAAEVADVERFLG